MFRVEVSRRPPTKLFSDPRVKKAESEQIVIALCDRCFVVEYLLEADEGRLDHRRNQMFDALNPLICHIVGRYYARRARCCAAQCAVLRRSTIRANSYREQAAACFYRTGSITLAAWALATPLRCFFQAPSCAPFAVH